ncbi:MAG: vWA domain protein [Bacteroidetes bacterium]|nr:vWA domain protein [Bacteroidota bacterium]
MFNGLEFKYPYVLLLLIIIPLIILWKRIYGRKTHTSINYSQVFPFEGVKKTWKIRLIELPNYVRYIILVLLIIVIARPQSFLSKNEKNIEGVDIVLALDISSSMLAEDFKPNRLEAAKDVAKEFIQGRKTDNIGVVVFSGEAFTQCPPTTDQNMLLNLLENVKSGIINDGTAIGDGIATAINRIKDTKTQSKVIILLTDGVNNMGAIDPLTAAELAKNNKIRVYTIGVGRMGMAPYPISTPMGKQYQSIEVKIDETLLGDVARITGGKYFRSKDKGSLETIFKEIDSMEKTIIDVSYYKQKKDLYLPFLLFAIILFFVEILLKKTIFKSVV